MIPLLQTLRSEVNELILCTAHLKHPPFLRRAEDDRFLLCSDAPRRLSDPDQAARRITEAGLVLVEKDGLWFLDAKKTSYEALAASACGKPAERPKDESLLSVWALARMLRHHPSPVSSQPLPAVRGVLKAMEESKRAVKDLAAELSPRMAVLLRKKEPLPALAGDLLDAWLWETLQREAV